MTALTYKSGPVATPALPGINHRCLLRRSLRTYELIDPANPAHILAYDVGQVKEIVQMDKRLREEGVLGAVPAGFRDFATRYNQYAVGPERFATYAVSHGRIEIQSSGSPIVWEHFKIDDWLVGCDRDSVEENASGPLSASTSALYAQQEILSFDIVDNAADPKLKALSGRMKVAMQTTDELTKFWIKRGAIEHQYASRLANLAETMIGASDSKELRRAIDAVRVETAQQAMRRHDLATRIAVDLEKRSLDHQLKQRSHWQDYYEPSARKIHDDQVRSSRRRSVASEWKQEYKKLRYSLDSRRLQSMKPDLQFARGPDIDSISEGSVDSPKGPSVNGLAANYEELCRSCWQLEKERSRFMEESLAIFIDTLSMTLETDKRSVNTINHWRDTFVAKDFIEEFLQKFGPSSNMDSNSSSHHRPLPHHPTAVFDQGRHTGHSSPRGSLDIQRSDTISSSSRELENDTRSPTPRERSRHSISSFGVSTTFGPRSINRTNSQSHRQSGLLPLSPEPPAASNRPTLSKLTHVFQRSGTPSSTSRSHRDDY